MHAVGGRAHRAGVVLVVACCLLPCRSLLAQASGSSGGDFPVRNSNVGYIDPAVVGNLFRLRLDSAWQNRVPSRAEFFYARTGPAGPGLPLPEPRIDYQDLSAHVEGALHPRFSVFAEVPFRFLSPQVNQDHAGLGDVNAGFKFAFLQDEDTLATFQLRTYAPSGDARRGLGNHHTSIEPALLLSQCLGERLLAEGEVRTWVPLDGTDFAGDVVRYGVGLGYEVYRSPTWRLTPIVEFVGWTVLNGREARVFPSGMSAVQDAAGETVANVKVGARRHWHDRADLYIGYGRPVTGDRWYENIVRVELRLSY
jgi:hypothetical protein